MTPAFTGWHGCGNSQVKRLHQDRHGWRAVTIGLKGAPQKHRKGIFRRQDSTFFKSGDSYAG
jgi:hypothetical protein